METKSASTLESKCDGYETLRRKTIELENVLDTSQKYHLRSRTCHLSKYPRGQRQNWKYSYSKSFPSRNTSTGHIVDLPFMERFMPMLSNLSREFKPNGKSVVIKIDSWKFVQEHTVVPRLRPQNLIVLVQTSLAQLSMHTRSTLVAKSSIYSLKTSS